MLRNITILVLIAALISALAFGLSSFHPASTDALASAPAGSRAVVEIDFRALRSSQIWADLTRADSTLEIEQISELCGFNPLEPLDRIILFMARAEGANQDDVTLLARGANLPHLDLATCLQRAVAEDGGSLEQVTIEGQPAMASAHGPTRAAFVGNDGLAIGMEEMVRMAIRVSNGTMESARTDATYARLWDALKLGSDIVGVGRIPDDLRQDLVARIPARLDLGPVDQVQAVGASANIHDGLRIAVIVAASSEEAANELVERWTEAVGRIRGFPLIGRTPVGPVLEQLEFRANGADIRADLELEAADLTRLASFARTISRRSQQPSEERREALRRALEELEPNASDDAGAPEAAPDTSTSESSPVGSTSEPSSGTPRAQPPAESPAQPPAESPAR